MWDNALPILEALDEDVASEPKLLAHFDRWWIGRLASIIIIIMNWCSVILGMMKNTVESS